MLFSLLIASSLGAYFSRRIIDGQRLRLILALGGAAVASLLIVLATPSFLDAALRHPAAIQFIAIATLIFPAGFLMGIPFPAGIEQLERQFPEAVCWAWTATSAASVLASTLSLFLAIHFGLANTAFVGVGCYLIAAAAWACSPQHASRQSSGTALAKLGQSISVGMPSVSPEPDRAVDQVGTRNEQSVPQDKTRSANPPP